MYKLLIDTNVLVDYYLGREPACSAFSEIIQLSYDKHALYVSALSLKDTYYLINTTLKRLERAESGQLSETSAHTCSEIAWSCIKQALDYSIVANIGLAEYLDAFVCKSVHADFEDDLVMASARSLHADYLVTSDEKLRSHSLVATLSPQEMASFLHAG